MSWLGSLIGAGGDVLGSLASSGLQYYLNKDLMGYANDLNKSNLLEGPSLQRKGLEDAGYNPLLALSGYTSGLPSVSPMSVGQSDMSNLGSSALSAYKKMTDSELSKQQRKVGEVEVDVKKAQAKDLDASKDLKDALKSKAEAEATKTKVDTFTDPARVITSAVGATATAYGAKKAIEAMKNRSKKSSKISVDEYRKGLEKVFSRSPSIGSKVLQNAGLVGALALPAFGAYHLNKKLEKVSPSARKIINTPNFGSRLR